MISTSWHSKHQHERLCEQVPKLYSCLQNSQNATFTRLAVEYNCYVFVISFETQLSCIVDVQSYLAQTLLVVIKEIIERKRCQLLDAENRNSILVHHPLRRKKVTQARPE